MIGPLKDADIDRLAKYWLCAEALVREYCGGAQLDQSAGALDLVQSILDAGVLSPDQTFELQSLGVVLGRVLAHNIEGLDWAVVDDEYGRDPTIRFRDTTLILNVLTMISKRVESGERPDTRDMYIGLTKQIAELSPEVD